MTSVIAAGSVSTAMSPSSTSTASTFFAITPLISSTDPGLRAAMVALLPAKRKRSPFVLIPVSAPSPSFRSIVVTAGAYVSPVTLPVAFAPSELFALLALPLDEPLLPHANIASVADIATAPSDRRRTASMFSFIARGERRSVPRYIHAEHRSLVRNAVGRRRLERDGRILSARRERHGTASAALVAGARLDLVSCAVPDITEDDRCGKRRVRAFHVGIGDSQQKHRQLRRVIARRSTADHDVELVFRARRILSSDLARRLDIPQEVRTGVCASGDSHHCRHAVGVA